MPETSDERDGQFWIIVGFQLPRAVLQHRRTNEQREEQRGELEAFYAMLTHGRIGVGEGGTRPPRWGDPAYPTQMHIDVLVSDLDAAEPTVLDHGATKLEEFPAPPAGWQLPRVRGPGRSPVLPLQQGRIGRAVWVDDSPTSALADLS